MSDVSIVLLAVALITLYVYARVRLSAFVQPARLELVDRAEKLLSHKDLAQDDRKWIEYSLDQVFSIRAAWTLALLILPLSIAMRFKSVISGQKAKPVIHQPHRKEIVEFVRVSVMVVLANSPLALLVFLFSLLLSQMLLLPAKAAVALAVQKSSVHGHHDGMGRHMRNGAA